MDCVTRFTDKKDTKANKHQLPGKLLASCHTYLVTPGPSHYKETYWCGRVGSQDDPELTAEDQQGMTDGTFCARMATYLSSSPPPFPPGVVGYWTPLDAHLKEINDNVE